MPSIIELIAEAEQKAEKIKKTALDEGNKIIADAKDDAQRAEQNAAYEVKILLQTRNESATNLGEVLARDILSDKEKETEKMQNKSSQNIDKAATAILERVTKK